jgi:DnaJ-domain-containing protein 1
LHKSGQSERAIESCEAARDHEQANLLLSKIYEELGDIESAINTLKSMLDLGFDTQDIHENINSLQKRANQPRDYYKILDLPRNADEKMVKKKYKQLAVIYHPDRCGKKGDTEGWVEEQCEKAFRDVADAKEVLSDSEKRRNFDHGIDPLNPENGDMQDDMHNSHFHSYDGFHDNFHGFHDDEFGSFFRNDDAQFQETFDYHFDHF